MVHPEAVSVLETPLASLKLKEHYPWARAAIVCTEYYGKYKFPASLQGMYAKFFLLSSAVPEYPNRKGKASFERWLASEGIHYEGGEINMPGRIFPLRPTAVAAGLGIFRKNNFFYGPKGSWYGLEGYLIDRSCEYIQEINLKPCAETCNLCQNACPYNRRHNWNEGEEFPGLKEIEALLQPENIISASDEELIQKVIPRSEYHLTDKQTDVLRGCAARVINHRKTRGQ